MGVLRHHSGMAAPADIKRVFGGKPVALMGATPGAGITAISQAAWLPALRVLGTVLWTGGRIGSFPVRHSAFR
jgi:hypothetical protein